MTIKEQYERYYSDIQEKVFNEIVEAFPREGTRNNTLSSDAKWALNNAYRNDPHPERFVEDLYKTKEDLRLFHRLVNSGVFSGDEADINRIKTKDMLYQIVKQHKTGLQTVKTNSQERHEGAEVVYDDGNWMCVVTHSYSANRYYGSHTRWCTVSSENTFLDYAKKGLLFVLINKKNNVKYQLHRETNSFRDEEDASADYATAGVPDALQSLIESGRITDTDEHKEDYYFPNGNHMHNHVVDGHERGDVILPNGCQVDFGPDIYIHYFSNKGHGKYTILHVNETVWDKNDNPNTGYGFALNTMKDAHSDIAFSDGTCCTFKQLRDGYMFLYSHLEEPRWMETRDGNGNVIVRWTAPSPEKCVVALMPDGTYAVAEQDGEDGWVMHLLPDPIEHPGAKERSFKVAQYTFAEDHSVVWREEGKEAVYAKGYDDTYVIPNSQDTYRYAIYIMEDDRRIFVYSKERNLDDIVVWDVLNKNAIPIPSNYTAYVESPYGRYIEFTDITNDSNPDLFLMSDLSIREIAGLKVNQEQLLTIGTPPTPYYYGLRNGHEGDIYDDHLNKCFSLGNGVNYATIENDVIISKPVDYGDKRLYIMLSSLVKSGSDRENWYELIAPYVSDDGYRRAVKMGEKYKIDKDGNEFRCDW